MSSPNSYDEVLTFNVTIFGVRAFKEGLRLNETLFFLDQGLNPGPLK